MSESEKLPWFPIPFWDGDTIMSASIFPRDNAKMLVPEPRTVLERNLDSFTAAVREKDHWWEKVNKADVVERWRSEAAQQDVDDKTFNFALQQLRHQAKQCDDLGVRPSPVPGVFESEQLLDTELRQQLLAALKPLEDVPDEDKDWHPGSDKQVLDVVHPSLFPLVYGLSRSTTVAKPPPPRNGLFSVTESFSRYSDIAADEPDGAPPGDGDPEVAAGIGVEGPAAEVEIVGDPEPPLEEASEPEDEEVPNDDPEGGDEGLNPDAAGPGPHADVVVDPEDTIPEDELPKGDKEGDEGDPPEQHVEEDYCSMLGKRMMVGAGQTSQERAAAADAAAAATTWHTPAFNAWKTAMGAGTVVTDPPPKSAFVSERFQWLPADVLVGADGRVVFDSYINNLHPERHAELYAATARLLERSVPLFERTLAASSRLPQRVAQIERDPEAWWQPDFFEWWRGMTESGEAASKVAQWRMQRLADAGHDVAPDDAQGAAALEAAVAAAVEEEYEDKAEEFADEVDELYNQRRRWVPPTLPDTFEPPPPPPQVDLRRRRLQVIVKYAEIVLTPEQPRYGGGVWHVEGMENEAIVASAIAYLAADNLSPSRLHFRTMVSDPSYAQGDNEGVRRMFGIEDEGRLNEPLGSVLCAPGRMLCWPNAFQHRVAPFQLADPSRPGVRKFTVFFLVDPRFRVISTRDVPPQQLAWHDEASKLGSLVPPEVKRKVDVLREFPISLERAKELRLELMEERKSGLKANNHETFERRFSLCEH